MSRRFAIVTPAFIASATRVDTAVVPGAKGEVLVLFRTSEQGHIIDTRPSRGSLAMQQAAVNALKQWKFKHYLFNGRPGQITSAVIFTFTGGASSVAAPGPMTAQQVSPVLRTQCWTAVSRTDPAAPELCKQQLSTVEKDSQSTLLEHFTAYDEYGIALLSTHQPKLAEEQFSKAIQLAPQGLTDSDAEWAYVYWHRGIAEQELGQADVAEHDLETAQASLSAAETAIGPASDEYYRELVGKISAQKPH